MSSAPLLVQDGPTKPELLAAQKLICGNRLASFVPTETQAQFLELTHPLQVFSGANWAGKTTICVIKLGLCIWETDNPIFQVLKLDHLKTFPRPLRFRIVAPSELLPTDVIPSLRLWWPKGSTRTFKGTRPFESLWRCYQYSHCIAEGDLMTYDQDPSQFEGVKLDLAFFNEPPPRAILSATIARMKPHGTIFIGMTPLSEAGYLFDRVSNPLGTTDWGLVYADLESACQDHGIGGYLPHQLIESKTAQYDPEEIEARLQGRPMHLSGLVYKAFSRPAHVVEPFDIPTDWPRFCVIDPHDRKPFAIIWAALSPTEKLVVYAESPTDAFHTIKTSSMTVPEYVTLIRQREADTGGPATTRILDARFGRKQSSQTGRSIQDLLDDHGLYFDESYLDQGGNVDHGHQQVKEWLRPGPDGTPSLQLFSTCHNTIYGFEHYCWDDFRRHPEGRMKERPKDVHKDFMDCIRYLVMDQPLQTLITPEATETTPSWVVQRSTELASLDA